MAASSISIKRVPHAPHTVDLSSILELRSLDYRLFQGTHIPAEYQEECGALMCAILRASFDLNDRTETVSTVTIWRPDDDRWIADAKIEDVIAYVMRGEGGNAC